MTNFSFDWKSLPSLMKRFKIKQSDLAKAMDAHPQLISPWITGKQSPSATTKKRVLAAVKELLLSRITLEADYTLYKLGFLRHVLACIGCDHPSAQRDAHRLVDTRDFSWEPPDDWVPYDKALPPKWFSTMLANGCIQMAREVENGEHEDLRPEDFAEFS